MKIKVLIIGTIVFAALCTACGAQTDKAFVEHKAPTKDMFIGHWKTDVVDTNIIELIVTPQYAQRWYDADELYAQGYLTMANEFRGKTVYECEKEQWEISKDGSFMITDGEYYYAEFKIDESGKFLVDANNVEKRYFKVK